LAKFVPDINLDKVSIIYNGVSEEYFPLDVKKQNLLLFVGARDEYKNFDLAVISASKANMPLFICGKKLTKEEKELLDKFLPSKYRFLGFISNEELNTYYNKAYALLYPSSYEGFGIPVIEAQKAGCPVIAMNSSSIPEIIGNDELLINDATPDAIIEKINILKDSEEREKIVKLGIENAKNYSWNKTFQNYQKLYQYIIKENFGKFQ
jgi:mannosyltransferase